MLSEIYYGYTVIADDTNDGYHKVIGESAHESKIRKPCSISLPLGLDLIEYGLKLRELNSITSRYEVP